MSDVIRCVCGREWKMAEAPAVCPACGMDVVAHAETLPPEPAASLSATTVAHNGAAPEVPPPAAVPGYEVLRELGRGGMGVVYEARQLSLGRVVALKMILSGAHACAAELARFRAEAQAIARLRHPNIIQIHEVGAHEGRPFFSLEYCAGGSLEKKLRGTPLKPDEAAALVETLARAVHAAHQKGVIHRDLKPANVLLAEDSSPRITDFGLAKAFGPDSDHSPGGITATNAIMGTPSYMAPEQAAGQARELGPACDAYALGAILYECLTGRPPFRAATPIDTLLQVMNDEPVAPSRLNPAVPRDLETVCLKCLAKVPAKRYASAEELGDDLSRWRKGEPIRARPLGRVERIVRWVRRHRLATAVLVQTAALVVVLIGVFAYYQIRETRSARQSLKQVQAEREQAQDALTRGYYEQARALLRSREPGRRWAALDLLGRAENLRGRERASDVIDAEAQPPSRAALRREAAAALLTEDMREVGQINASFPVGLFSAVAPDASWLMTAFIRQPEKPGETLAGGLRLFDLRDGRKLGELLRLDLLATKAIGPAPDAKTVAFVGALGNIDLFEFPSGQKLRTLARPRLPMGLKPLNGLRNNVIQFSPDGRWLIAGDVLGKESDVYVWDLKSPDLGGRHLARVATGLEGVSVRPDSGAVAIPRGGSLIGIWDLAKSGPPIDIDVKFAVESEPRLAAVAGIAHNALVWSPNGSRLAVTAKVGDKLNLAVWNVAGGRELLRWDSPIPAETSALAFTPDGRRILVGDGLGTVHCLDLDDRQEVWTIENVAPVGIYMMKWRADGRLLTAGMFANQLRVWEPSRDTFERSLATKEMAITNLAFHPDGKWLVLQSGGQEHLLRLLPVGSQEKSWTLPLPGEGAKGEALQFQGHEVAVFCQTTTVVLDLDRRQEVRRLAAKPAPRGFMSIRTDENRFMPDGRLVSTEIEPVDKERRITVRDRATGQQLGPPIVVPRVNNFVPFAEWSCRFSDDGKLLAICPSPMIPSRDPINIWKVETGEKVTELPAGDETVMSMKMQFSPDGKSFLRLTVPFSYDSGAAKSSDMRLTLSESETGKRRWQIPSPFPPDSVAFSADSKLLAVGYDYGGVDVYDAQTGEQLLRWNPPGLRNVDRMAFAPDASLLAAAAGSGPVRLLNLRDLRKRLAELRLDW
jgi:WD40 repeat protein